VSEEQPISFTGRAVMFVILALLLVVFPAMSWVYLRNGLQWRRTVQAELRNYGKIDPVYYIQSNKKIDLTKGNVCVLHNFGDSPALTAENKEIMALGEKLYDQFGQNGHFRLTMIADNAPDDFRAYARERAGANGAAWIWAGSEGSWRGVLQNAYEYYTLHTKETPVKAYFAVSDTLGTIRCFYDVHNRQQINQLVTHVSLLLPN
jgi:hypothetical protein